MTPRRWPPAAPGVPYSPTHGLTEEAPLGTFRSKWRCRPAGQQEPLSTPAGWEGGQGAGSMGTRAGQPQPLLAPATVSGACGRRVAGGGPLGGASSPSPEHPCLPRPPSAPHSHSTCGCTLWKGPLAVPPWLGLPATLSISAGPTPPPTPLRGSQLTVKLLGQEPGCWPAARIRGPLLGTPGASLWSELRLRGFS